ncbi:MAG: ABC transporter ATP-binding protein [Lentisphaerae bacterium]|nr:ABC transporter ATP-binding protein [Lentisphaerota bacterium]
MNDERLGGRPPLSNRRLVARLLGMVWKYRLGCVRTLLLQTALLALGISGLGLTGVGVDFLRCVLADRAGGLGVPPRWPFGLAPPASWAPMHVIAAIAVAVLIFAALRSALNVCYAVSMNRLLQGQVVVNLRSAVYDKMQQLSFTFFDANASGGLINRVTADVQQVRGFVDGVVLQSVVLILSLGVYLAYMIRIHATLTLASLATTPLLAVATTVFSRRVRPAYVRNRELFDNQVATLSENVQGVHIVKGFARRQNEIDKFTAATRKVRDQKRWIFDQQALFQPFIGMLTQVNIVVLLAYGGWLAVRHAQGGAGITVGQLLVFAGLLQQFSGQVAGIAGIADSMQMSLTAAQRVFEILDAPVAVRSPPNPARLTGRRHALRFEHVGFAYRPGAPILADVCLEVAAGMRVAILGATGAGKTTLLSLVPRFYDVTGGALVVDGRDVRSLELAQLRRHIGIVFQDSFLFSNTVRANIAFGHPSATAEQVERAARLAAADDFIAAMPQGYDTVLREGGSNLSGGQRQRIAIARALLLDPPILLLDDPTAAVDPETEAEILQAVEQAMAGRTVLLVAHRLSALRRADRVVVLERGRVIQFGPPEELIRADGLYRDVAALQTADDSADGITEGRP